MRVERDQSKARAIGPGFRRRARGNLLQERACLRKIDAPAQRRHRGQEQRPVRLFGETRIQHRDHAPIGARADEAARALREHERGDGEVDGNEGIEAALLGAGAARSMERFVGHRERDLVDDHEHTRRARGVDAGPERSGADQDRRLVVDEVLGQRPRVAIALRQDVMAGSFPQDLREPLDVRVRRAEHEGPPARGVHELAEPVRRLVHPRVASAGGVGKILADVEDPLLFPLERRRRLHRRVAPARVRGPDPFLVPLAPGSRCDIRLKPHLPGERAVWRLAAEGGRHRDHRMPEKQRVRDRLAGCDWSNAEPARSPAPLDPDDVAVVGRGQAPEHLEPTERDSGGSLGVFARRRHERRVRLRESFRGAQQRLVELLVVSDLHGPVARFDDR